MSKIRQNIEYYRTPDEVETNIGSNNVSENFIVNNIFSNSYTTNSYLSGGEIEIINIYATSAMSSLFQTTTYTYDISGNIDTITTDISGGDTFIETYTYDLSGNNDTITKVTS